MKNRRALLAPSLVLLSGSLATALAQQQVHTTPDSTTQNATVTAAANPVSSSAEQASSTGNSRDLLIHDAQAERLEGEKRYRTNCGRCHVAPSKFPPRTMATVLRHMRVRALITDEDRRLIFLYMTQ